MKHSNEEVAAADWFCDQLKDSIMRTVSETIPQKVVLEITK